MTQIEVKKVSEIMEQQSIESLRTSHTKLTADIDALEDIFFPAIDNSHTMITDDHVSTVQVL